MEMAMVASSIGIVFEEISPCGKSVNERKTFGDFKSALEYVKNNPGKSFSRNPNGSDWVIN